MFPASDRQAMAPPTNPDNGEHVHANATYWFERELRQYSAIDLDLDSISAHADRIVLVAGRESRGYPTYQVNVALGRRLGRDVVEMPGGHTGYVTQPVEFAHKLLRVIAPAKAGPPA